MLIKVLGIAASPRKGNSLYLMEQALGTFDGQADLPFRVESEIYSLNQKKIGPCIACGACKEKKKCIIADDFPELFSKWVTADVVLYSSPVYHLGIPAQLKAFFDRLGNTIRRYYGLESPKNLKVIGGIIQGQHFYAGEELSLSTILHHAVLLNSIPVPGDRWESYLGAVGWTKNIGDRNAMAGLKSAGDPDIELTLNSARSMTKRAVELAAILKAGAQVLREQLAVDKSYYPLLSRLEE